jgi:hypothetical protein
MKINYYFRFYWFVMSSNERLTRKQAEEIRKILKLNPKPHTKDIEKISESIDASSERVSAYIRRFNSTQKIPTKKRKEDKTKENEHKTIKLTEEYFTQPFIDSLTTYVKSKSEMNEETFLNEEAILTFGIFCLFLTKHCTLKRI